MESGKEKVEGTDKKEGEIKINNASGVTSGACFKIWGSLIQRGRKQQSRPRMINL